MLLAIANQPIDTNTTYTVGADVSRFQRGSVPARPPEPVSNASAPAPGGVPTDAEGRPVGPVVRIARGNNITLVPVGAR